MADRRIPNQVLVSLWDNSEGPYQSQKVGVQFQSSPHPEPASFILGDIIAPKQTMTVLHFQEDGIHLSNECLHETNLLF